MSKFHNSSGIQVDRTFTSNRRNPNPAKKRLKWEKQGGLRSMMNDIGVEPDRWDKIFPGGKTYCDLCLIDCTGEFAMQYINGKVRSFCSPEHIQDYKDKLKEGFVCKWCGRPVYEAHRSKHLRGELFCSEGCTIEREDFVV